LRARFARDREEIPMSRNTTVILILIAVLFIVPAVIAAIVGLAVLLSREGGFIPEKRVALIRVEGIITSGRGSGGLFGDGGAGAERIIDTLEAFRKDKGVKAGVIRINSPGGSPAGSQEVYREIIRLRREGKKITVSMGDVAASGAYYIASSADRIFANPATITGSIGVIMETSDIHDLLGRVGIKLDTIKSGKYKDIGSYSRPMTPAERALLQGLSDDIYDQFVSDVSEGRKKVLTKEQVRGLADGRVYTGRQALKLKLVDELGSLEQSLKSAARDAGIKGEFRVTEYERDRGVFDTLFGASETSLPAGAQRWALLGEFVRKLLRTEQLAEMR